jgi:hypothetical protein
VRVEAEQQDCQRIVGDMETARFSDGLAAKAETARVEPERFDSERIEQERLVAAVEAARLEVERRSIAAEVGKARFEVEWLERHTVDLTHKNSSNKIICIRDLLSYHPPPTSI